MDVARMMINSSPTIIASLVLLVAAICKLGRERGSVLILLGAIGMSVMALTVPVFYVVFMPRIIEVMKGMDGLDVSTVYRIVAVIVQIFWGVSIALIAIGTFLRNSPVAQQRYVPAIPVEYEIDPKT